MPKRTLKGECTSSILESGDHLNGLMASYLPTQQQLEVADGSQSQMFSFNDSSTIPSNKSFFSNLSRHNQFEHVPYDGSNMSSRVTGGNQTIRKQHEEYINHSHNHNNTNQDATYDIPQHHTHHIASTRYSSRYHQNRNHMNNNNNNNTHGVFVPVLTEQCIPLLPVDHQHQNHHNQLYNNTQYNFDVTTNGFSLPGIPVIPNILSEKSHSSMWDIATHGLETVEDSEDSEKDRIKLTWCNTACRETDSQRQERQNMLYATNAFKPEKQQNGKRYKWPAALRQQILVESEAHGISKTAEKYGVNRRQIQRWRKCPEQPKQAIQQPCATQKSGAGRQPWRVEIQAHVASIVRDMSAQGYTVGYKFIRETFFLQTAQRMQNNPLYNPSIPHQPIHTSQPALPADTYHTINDTTDGIINSIPPPPVQDNQDFIPTQQLSNGFINAFIKRYGLQDAMKRSGRRKAEEELYNQVKQMKLPQSNTELVFSFNNDPNMFYQHDEGPWNAEE